MPPVSRFARVCAAALLALAIAAAAVSLLSTLRGRYLGLRVSQGGEVEAVEPGGPADDAGLRVGDVVREVAGAPPRFLAGPVAAGELEEAAARADLSARVAAREEPLEIVLAQRTVTLAPASVPLPRVVLGMIPAWLTSAVFVGVALLLLARGRPRRGFPVALAIVFLAVPVDQLSSAVATPSGVLAPLGLVRLSLNLAGHLCASAAVLVLFGRFPRLDSEEGVRDRGTLLAAVPGLAVLLWAVATGSLAAARLSGILWSVAALGFLVLNLVRLDRQSWRQLTFVIWATVLVLPLYVLVDVPALVGVDAHVLRSALNLAVVLIPGTFALAFVQHRLFDVVRLARGTLVWGLLTAAVLLTFAAGAAGLEALVPAPASPYFRTALAVLIALALRPSHALAQRLVDQVFFRGRFDHQRHLDVLADRLARAEQMPDVSAALARLLDQTVMPESQELTVDGDGAGPSPEIRSRLAAGGEELEVPLVAGGRREGTLKLGPRRAALRYGSVDRRLLSSAAVPVALALCRLRTVRELAEANEALRRSLEELSSSQERVVRQERLAALGEMSSAIVHEIRHPLGIMGMGLHMLMRTAEKLPREAVQEIERIQAAHGDATEVIRVVQKVSRDLQVVAAPWSAEDLVVESVSGLGDEASERRVEVETEVSDDLPPVSADRRTLTQALGILLRNAVEASPEGGRVRLTVCGAGPVQFEVRDEGPGVPERDRERIFEPFFTTKPTGMGLGLAYARKVAQAHGGSLTLRASDVGALFVLEVPAWSGPGEALPARRRLRSA